MAIMSNVIKIDGLKETELKRAFNSAARAYSHSPEAEQIKLDIIHANMGDPNMMGGRMVPGGTVLSSILNGSAEPEKKKEFDRFIQDILFLDMMRAINQRIAELSEIIERLSDEIEKNLERLAGLDTRIDERSKTIKKVNDYLRTGKIERHVDGALTDRSMNNLFLSHLRLKNLQTQNLNEYSASDIRLFLDAAAADLRSDQEREKNEQRHLSLDTERKTESMNEAIEERKQLKEIVVKYERIQTETPGARRDQKAGNLLDTLSADQIRKLQLSQEIKDKSSESLTNKTSAVHKEMYEDEQKVKPNYMKDLGI